MLNQNILTNMLVSNSITKVDIVKGPHLETYFIPGGAESIAAVIAKSDMRSVMRFTADYENGFIAVASGGKLTACSDEFLAGEINRHLQRAYNDPGYMATVTMIPEHIFHAYARENAAAILSEYTSRQCAAEHAFSIARRDAAIAYRKTQKDDCSEAKHCAGKKPTPVRRVIVRRMDDDDDARLLNTILGMI